MLATTFLLFLCVSNGIGNPLQIPPLDCNDLSPYAYAAFILEDCVDSPTLKGDRGLPLDLSNLKTEEVNRLLAKKTYIGFSLIVHFSQITSVNAPLLKSMKKGSSITIKRNDNLTSFSFPKLTQVSHLFIMQNSLLKTVELPSLGETVLLEVDSNPALFQLDLPQLRNSYRIKIRQNDVLKMVYLPNTRKFVETIITENMALETIQFGEVEPGYKAFNLSYNPKLVDIKMNATGKLHKEFEVIGNDVLQQKTIDFLKTACVGCNIQDIEVPTTTVSPTTTIVETTTQSQICNELTDSHSVQFVLENCAESPTLKGNTELDFSSLKNEEISALLAKKESIGANVTVSNNSEITNINAPLLKVMLPEFAFKIIGNSKLTSISFPLLNAGSLSISENPQLKNLKLPNLVEIEILILKKNSAIESLELPKAEVIKSLRIDLNGGLKIIDFPKVGKLHTAKIQRNIQLKTIQFGQVESGFKDLNYNPKLIKITITAKGSLKPMQVRGNDILSQEAIDELGRICPECNIQLQGECFLFAQPVDLCELNHCKLISFDLRLENNVHGKTTAVITRVLENLYITNTNLTVEDIQFLDKVIVNGNTEVYGNPMMCGEEARLKQMFVHTRKKLTIKVDDCPTTTEATTTVPLTTTTEATTTVPLTTTTEATTTVPPTTTTEATTTVPPTTTTEATTVQTTTEATTIQTTTESTTTKSTTTTVPTTTTVTTVPVKVTTVEATTLKPTTAIMPTTGKVEDTTTVGVETTSERTTTTEATKVTSTETTTGAVKTTTTSTSAKTTTFLPQTTAKTTETIAAEVKATETTTKVATTTTAKIPTEQHTTEVKTTSTTLLPEVIEEPEDLFEPTSAPRPRKKKGADGTTVSVGLLLLSIL